MRLYFAVLAILVRLEYKPVDSAEADYHSDTSALSTETLSTI